MRRSIQIASACAFLMVAAAPVTGLSDGLAAEAEKLPCNNFCRTWMGNQTGEAAPPQASPSETVTIKPHEVFHDPEPAVDDPATRSVEKSASQIDGEGKPSHLKPKRKTEPDVADVSDHRSVTARSKTKKIAKSPKLDDDIVFETQSDSESSPSQPRLQPEKNHKTPSHNRNATSSQPVKVTEREVPLPPRLPRAMRPSRTGTAQVGQNATDELRAGVIDEQPASSRTLTKAPRTVTPALNPDTPQADAPHAAMGSIASAASKTVDKVSTGAGDSAASSPPSLAGSNVIPLVDAPQAGRVTPPSAQRRPAVPDRAETAASPPSTTTPSPIAVDGTAAPDAPPPAGPVVASASVPDKQTARVAPKPEVPPPAVTAAPEAAAKSPPNTIGTKPVVVEGSMAAPPPPQARGVVSPSNSNEGEAQAAAPSPSVMLSGEAAAKDPPSTLGTGPALSVEGTMAAVPPTSAGRAIVPLSNPDKVASQGSAPSPSQDAGSPSALVASGEAVQKDPPTMLGDGPASAVDGIATAASPSPVRQTVGPASDPDKQSAGVASQAPAPVPTVVVSGEAAPQDQPTTLGSGPAVGVGALTDSAAKSATASTGAARTNRNDDSSHPVAAFPDAPTPAVSGLSVSGPGQAPVHEDAPVTAMNDAHSAVSEITPRNLQGPLALPDVNRETTPDNGRRADPPAPSASSPTKAPVESGSGALGKIDNTDRAPPGEEASIVMAPPSGAVPADENPATHVKFAIGDVSTQPEGTTITYTITNPATAPVDLLFVRCNAVDTTGAVIGSAFDYVENIPAGQQVKRVVRVSSDVTLSGQTFSCSNDAATQ